MKSLLNLLLLSSLTISSVYAQTPSVQVTSTEANLLIAGNFPGKSLKENNFTLNHHAGTGYADRAYKSSGISSVLSSGSCITGAPQWSIGGDNITGLGLANTSIGTCDNADFVLKSNNTDRIWIKPNGRMGINITNPSAALSVQAPDINTPFLSMNSGWGAIFVNKNTQMEIGTSDQNVGDPFSIHQEDQVWGDTKIFSTDYQGNTKVHSVNTTVGKPAFTVQGIDLTADAQNKLGTTFSIHGNQTGDVSSSRDMSLFYNGSNGGRFYIYNGVPNDGGLYAPKINASAKFIIDGNSTQMTDNISLGGFNATNIPSSGSALTILNSSSKAIAIYPKTGNAVAGTANFVVFNNGSTSIGDAYVPSGYKLAVNGKIITEEVVVQFRNTWPDYVFQKDYKLKPLAEVEKYIVGHQHLQGIPSAKDIETEGVKLGDIVSKQMEKIEELTLYLIEQQKQIEHLKKEVESLKH